MKKSKGILLENRLILLPCLFRDGGAVPSGAPGPSNLANCDAAGTMFPVQGPRRGSQTLWRNTTLVVIWLLRRIIRAKEGIRTRDDCRQNCPFVG